MKCKKCRREIENLDICPYCESKQITKKVIKNAKKKIEETEKEVSKIPFFNNVSAITFILFGLLVLNLMLNTYNNVYSSINFILHNIVNIVFAIYFVLLQFDFGKKYFKYLNYIVGIMLSINFIDSFFNIFVLMDMNNMFLMISSLLLLVFYVKAFISNKVDNIDLVSSVDNKGYFYFIVGSFLVSFFFNILNIVSNFNLIDLVFNIINLFITLFLARYIYLYLEDKTGLFLEIEKKQLELDNDKIKYIIKNINSKYNKYQIIAIIIFICGLALGLVLGSEQTDCVALYSLNCDTGFNFSLFLIVTFISFILSLFIYWQGEVINYLREIKEKDKKKVKKSVKKID